jgi:hypothetical protein
MAVPAQRSAAVRSRETGQSQQEPWAADSTSSGVREQHRSLQCVRVFQHWTVLLKQPNLCVRAQNLGRWQAV